MYLPVERTSRRFSLGSYRPLRSWYRCVTADTVYACPSIVTLSPQWMFCFGVARVRPSVAIHAPGTCTTKNNNTVS